jgi:hypothetical protein
MLPVSRIASDETNRNVGATPCGCPFFLVIAKERSDCGNLNLYNMKNAHFLRCEPPQSPPPVSFRPREFTLSEVEWEVSGEIWHTTLHS